MGYDNNKGLSQMLIQILAWFALFMFYITDKLMHLVQPPLEDLWYAIATGIGVFGRGFENAVKLWFKGKGG